ncbi:MAG: tRNA pseudouridine(55) synthase TruB [Propionibacteriaceae bacterium]|jgi:tRNA pseudouridine55 synthase|nr:tRNA pseudouridine(55) synthase TruB [Propionibacteriaceae bacterium]
MNSPEAGLVILDKPAGLTSQQAVTRVKRLLGVKKAGHAGTLDPLATGVLVVGVGRATRLLGFVSGHDKEYRATVRLGQATSTDDAEGEPLPGPEFSELPSRARIEAAFARFQGKISQVPSAVSAIKVDGKRAYALARAGEQVELSAREVEITRLDVLSVTAVEGKPLVDVEIEVACSSGTYIRALARDTGRALGTGGHLTALRRTRVGAFGIEEAAALPEVAAADSGNPPQRPALPVLPIAAAARRVFPAIEVGEAAAEDVRHGRPLALNLPADPAALFHDGEFLALYQPAGQAAKALAVFV